MIPKSLAIAGLALAVVVVGGWLLWSSGIVGGAGGDDRGGVGLQPPPPLVTATPARTGRVEELVRAVGSVEAVEQVEITAQVTGKVSAIRFEEGQRVHAGDLLVLLDSERQEAALQVARAEQREARRQLDRMQALESVAVSAADLDEARARMDTADARVAEARADLADRRIAAPFAGTVGLREVSPGALVQPGTVITTLATIDALKVRFELPATLLPSLRTGLPLRVAAVGFGREFKGRITRIDNTVDRATRSIAIEGSLEAGEGLRPGVFVTIDIVLNAREDAVLIPEEAVVLEGDESYVYVIGADGTAERRMVATGVRRPGKVEVRGLDPGAMVVVEGVQKVQPGRPVQLREAAATGAPP